MASREVSSEEVNSINPARRAISILEKNMVNMAFGAAASSSARSSGTWSIGTIVRDFARDVAVSVTANLVSKFLGDWLGGAPKAGGAECICNKMHGHQPTDICKAASNTVNSAYIDAAKEALNRLCDKLGMPKFLRDDLHKEFDKILKQHHQECNPATQKALNDCIGQDVKDKVRNLAEQLAKDIENLLKDRLEGESRVGGCSGGRRISAKSWIAAIAEALGKVQGQKAEEMMNLTNKVSDISEKQIAFEKENGGIDPKDEKAKQKYDSEKSKLAAEMTKAQAELQGVQQEYKLISETTSTLLKTLGETLSGMARKQ